MPPARFSPSRPTQTTDPSPAGSRATGILRSVWSGCHRSSRRCCSQRIRGSEWLSAPDSRRRRCPRWWRLRHEHVPGRLQWSCAQPESPCLTGRRNSSPPPSLVPVDAPAPAVGSRVITASRRKVVGVDCVERFLPIRSPARQGGRQGELAGQGACRVRPRSTSEAGADWQHPRFRRQRAASGCVGTG